MRKRLRCANGLLWRQKSPLSEAGAAKQLQRKSLEGLGRAEARLYNGVIRLGILTTSRRYEYD